MVGFQAVSPRSRLGTCKFLHGVAENQAHFPKERQKIIHLTRLRWSNSRHSKARLRNCGRKAGTETKNMAENRPPPENWWQESFHLTEADGRIPGTLEFASESVVENQALKRKMWPRIHHISEIGGHSHVLSPCFRSASNFVGSISDFV